MDTFNPNQMPPVMQTPLEKKSPIGPMIAVVIILVLIIVGGLYFLKQRSSQPVYTPPSVTNENPVDVITDTLNTQNKSDDLESIEADLNATIIDNLDQGATAIEAQLQ